MEEFENASADGLGDEVRRPVPPAGMTPATPGQSVPEGATEVRPVQPTQVTQPVQPTQGMPAQPTQVAQPAQPTQAAPAARVTRPAGESDQPTQVRTSVPQGGVASPGAHAAQPGAQPTQPRQPGYQQQAQPRYQYQAPRQPQAQTIVRTVPAQQKRWPAFLSGLIGAILGAGLMLGGTTIANRIRGIGAGATVAEVESSAGPVIDIAASGEDITISQAVAAKALPSVASIYVTTATAAGVGSGVLIDAEGNILTNYHVIEGAQTISVTLGEKSYDATIVGSDASSDLAVIKVDLGEDEATPIEVGDSDSLVVGDWVMAIGSPYGLDQSVSTGIVSSLYRSTMLPSASGNQIYANLIQTDAAINPGNSGGALVNSRGQLVGINSIIESASGASAGIGFAIAGNYAVDVAKTIIAGEDVLHAYIGLSLQTVNARNAQQAGLSVNQGAYVADVTSGAPGDAAGIQVGDVITRVGKQQIISADALILAVRSHKVGETVDVTLVRGEEERTVQVTLGDDAVLQAAQEEQQSQQQDQGFSLEDLFGWGVPDGSYGNGYGYGGGGSGNEG